MHAALLLSTLHILFIYITVNVSTSFCTSFFLQKIRWLLCFKNTAILKLHFSILYSSPKLKASSIRGFIFPGALLGCELIEREEEDRADRERGFLFYSFSALSLLLMNARSQKKKKSYTH